MLIRKKEDKYKSQFLLLATPREPTLGSQRLMTVGAKTEKTRKKNEKWEK